MTSSQSLAKRVDREAAAEYVFSPDAFSPDPAMRARWQEVGEALPLVRAFARHRIAAQSDALTSPAQVEQIVSDAIEAVFHARLQDGVEITKVWELLRRVPREVAAALTLPEQPCPVDLRSLEIAPGQDLSDALAHGIEWDKSDPVGLTAAIYHACETIRAALGHKDRGGE